MATTAQSMPTFSYPALSEQVNVAIIDTEWNSAIAGAMTRSAIQAFKDFENKTGVSVSVEKFTVPGAVELTFAASQAIENLDIDAVIVFGCVIRGGTPHFDYVCQSVTQGVTTLNADVDVPVIFGVLTVENEQQAIDRINGTVGDKGAECAHAALKMVEFKRNISD